MRFRVIDTIQFNSSCLHRFAEFQARFEGVMAVLDPNQIQQVPEIEGRTIMICRPDGSVKQLIAYSAEARSSVVGIFFKGATSEDIPRGAELHW